ncbi:MAG: GNAT family N-acetyltransferase [Polyangiaceae bacterium]
MSAAPIPPPVVRSAVAADTDWLVTAIIEAEKSGTDATLFRRVFALDETAERAALASILAEDVSGSELAVESFLVAELDGVRAGCIATWIEADDGPPSSHVKATLWSHVLGAPVFRAAAPALKRTSAIDIPREKGALQIESVFVEPAFRGRRVVSTLVARALERTKAERPDVQKAQILSVLENTASAKAFAHAGFARARETSSSDPDLRMIFPGSGRILWERAL